MYFLSVDFGTSSVKLSILDDNLRTLQWAKEEYSFQMLPGDKVEMEPEVVFTAFLKAAGCLDEALRAKVELFCYDTFSPSLTLMDEDGTALHPVVTHLDRRSREQIDTVCDVMGKDKFMSLSGVYPFAGGISLMPLLWFQQHMPELLQKTKRIGHFATYIHKRLTGLWAVDLVNASMMGLYNTTTQSGWSDEICSAFNVDKSWLCEIRNPGIVHGKLDKAIADKLGVPGGIPVALGTNDAAVAHMGAGNDKPGMIFNAAGSSEMVSVLTDKAVFNPNYYLRNAVLPGLWQIYATTAGGFAVDWFYEEFCKEMSRKEFYGYITESLSYIGENPVSFEPYLTGDRQSLEKKTGQWKGLTLATSRGQMLCALLESMQDVLYRTIIRAKESVVLDTCVKVSGGMTTPEYIKLKEKKMPGFSFKVVDDCPIIGNAALAKYYM